jgi:hypothetical protein
MNTPGWKRLAMSCLLAVAATPIVPAPAQDAAPVPVSETPAPFVYSPGHTTLVEARDYWTRNGARILGAGHLALGTGSGTDNASLASAERVILVDVSGIDFEGVPAARFGFFDGTLYQIQVRLRPWLKVRPLDSTDQQFTDEQIAALEARLRQEHGRPATHRTIFAHKGESDDELVWTIDGHTLTLMKSVKTLVLTDKRTEADIAKYVKEYCKTVNKPGRIICW